MRLLYTFCSIVLVIVIANSDLFAQRGRIFVKNIRYDSGMVAHAEVVYFKPGADSAKPLTKTDLSILESGIPVELLSVTCPPGRPRGPVSSVLTIDVSGSMARGGPNIRLAKAAAEAWITALGDTSECAITSFDHRAFLNLDFTTDKQELLETLPTLTPRGGTDYFQGLASPVAGGVTVAKQGRFRRVMIFLTDGFGLLNPSEIVSAALNDSITVYCVSLGLSMPTTLKEVSEKTGGLWFENVTTVDEAVLAYKRIFSDVHGSGGCVAEWKTSLSCENERTLQIGVAADTASFATHVHDRMTSRAVLSATSVEFGIRTAADTSFKRVVVRPIWNAISIASITIDRPGDFEFLPIKLPVAVLPGDSLVVLVRPLRFADSTYTVGRISIQTTPCPLPDVYVTTGDVRVKPRTNSLRVVHPNGGESFLAKSMVQLAYEGLPPTVPVKVEISSNGGISWVLVRQGNTGNEIQWESFNDTRDSCLLRVTHELSTEDMSFPFITLTSAAFFDVSISSDGTTLVTTEYVSRTTPKSTIPVVKFWNVESGQKLFEVDGGERVMYLGNTSNVLTWNARSISVISTASKNILWTRSGFGSSMPTSVSATPDGRAIVVTGSSADSSIVLNASNGSLIFGTSRNGKPARWASLADATPTLAICEADSLVRIIDVSNAKTLFEIREPGVERYYSSKFSPDGTLLIVTNSLGNTELWDVAARKRVRNLASRQYVNDNTYAAFSPDGLRIAVETGRDQTRIFETATGKDIVIIKRSADVGGVQDAKFTADGQYVILTSVGSVGIYDAYSGQLAMKFRRGEGLPSLSTSKPYMALIGSDRFAGVVEIQSPVLQQDVSDSLWRIFRPRAQLKNIRFASRLVGQSIDTVLIAGVKNISSDSIYIGRYRIEGAQAEDFSVSSEGGFVLAPGDSSDIQYSYHPKGIGERAALIVCETSGGLIHARITGPCRGDILTATSGMYDVGVVTVGSKSTVIVKAMLQNTSNVPITIDNMKLISSLKGVFSIEPTFPLVIAAGQSVDIPVTFQPPSRGSYSAVAEIRVGGITDPVIATIVGRGAVDAFAGLTDPTTFRSILLPSAVVPKQGTLSTGVYDVLGLFVGYSVTDFLMVQAGGSLPLPTKWLGETGYDASLSTAWSLGAKLGIEIADNVILGGGYQFGTSYYDQEFSPLLESKITFNAVWSSVGLGTDDSRLNVYLGYTFKNHQTSYEGSFIADATTVGAAYDIRMGEHWKLCSEVFFMRTMTLVPVTFTARYFRQDDAFELGFTVIGIPASGARAASFPVVPMLSWLKRW